MLHRFAMHSACGEWVHEFAQRCTDDNESIHDGSTESNDCQDDENIPGI
jgi:hypothetical protein